MDIDGIKVTVMGYTTPPRPGAIGPDAGEMDPNGDEGARE